MPGSTVPKPTIGARRKWYTEPTPGKWHFHLEEIARKKGFVHVNGHLRGQINIYRLGMAAGISPNRLNAFLHGRELDHLGTKTLGRLCDALECQLSDLLERVPADAVLEPRLARFDIETRRENRLLAKKAREAAPPVDKPDTSW